MIAHFSPYPRTGWLHMMYNRCLCHECNWLFCDNTPAPKE